MSKRKPSLEISNRQNNRRLKASTDALCEAIASTSHDDAISSNSPVPVKRSGSEMGHSLISNTSSDEDWDENIAYRTLSPTTVKDGPDNATEVTNCLVEISKEETRISRLRKWALQYSINHTALNALLVLLKETQDEKLPKDARSLLHTPRSTYVKEMEPGFYFHFGVRNGLERVLSVYKSMLSKLSSEEPLALMVGVDGVPLSHSSKSQFWPILGKCKSFANSEIFIIGLYHGNQKPTDSNKYLHDFVKEMISLSEDGFTFEGRSFKVKLWALIADAPAKSYVICTKGHTGFYSCTKCTVHGKYNEQYKRVCFPSEIGQLRTHKDFIDHVQEEHHVNHTILEEIPHFDIVDDIPLDYMHLVCLGVTKKLLLLWISGKPPHKLQTEAVQRISKILISFRSFTAAEFSRKPRPIEEINHWKATELRQFLLYSGPVALRTAFQHGEQDIRFLHFLTLHLAIRILVSKNFLKYIGEAQKYLNSFVKYFGIIYGEHLISHNVHGLLHLVRDVENFGPLDEFSAFCFENYMQPLKRDVRKYEKCLQQVVHRHLEKMRLPIIEVNENADKISYDLLHSDGPLLGGCTNPQYKKVRTLNFILSTNEADNTCQIGDGSIIKIENFCFSTEIKNSAVVIGKEYLRLSPLFSKPEGFSEVKGYKISKLSEISKMWPVESIVSKFIRLPLKDGEYAAMLLVHSQE